MSKKHKNLRNDESNTSANRKASLGDSGSDRSPTATGNEINDSINSNNITNVTKETQMSMIINNSIKTNDKHERNESGYEPSGVSITAGSVQFENYNFKKSDNKGGSSLVIVNDDQEVEPEIRNEVFL